MNESPSFMIFMLDHLAQRSAFFPERLDIMNSIYKNSVLIDTYFMYSNLKINID